MKLADQPSDFGTLVTNAYGFFKPLFSQLIWIIVIQYLALIGVAVIVGILAFLLMDTVGKGIIFLFVIAALFLMGYFLSAQFARAYGVMWKNESFITQTWKIAKNRYLKATGLLVCISLLLSVVSTGFLIISTMIGAVLHSGILIAVSILLTLIFAMYLGVRLYLSMPLLVAFDQGVFNAIKQSWHATHRRFWKTFGVLFLVVFIPTLALMGLQLLLSGENIILVLLRLVVSILGNIAIMILTVSAIYVLLNDYMLRENVPTTAQTGTSKLS